MKNPKNIIIISILGLLSYILIGAACIEKENKSQECLFNLKGRSITFIMGEDKRQSNYYSLATEHFLNDPIEKSEVVVTSCRTLACVIEYLNIQLENDHWSTVNIVAHGNPNTGINLHLYDDGPKATPKRMLQAVLMDTMPHLKLNSITSDTQINFWSCGIGKNPVIKLSLEKMFQPDGGDSTSVYCSPFFVVFKADKDNSIRRLNLSYWPYYYKRGYRPSQSEITYQLANQFPDDNISWQDALDNRQSESLYSEEYHIPVSYTKVYKSKVDRPDFNSETDKINWVKSQNSIIEQIKESGIPIDKFTWQVNKIIHINKYGEQVPAIKAIGMATVLNVLQVYN